MLFFQKQGHFYVTPDFGTVEYIWGKVDISGRMMYMCVLTESVSACVCLRKCTCVRVLTVLAGLDVQDIAPDPVPSLGVGQHLHTVVSELLQPSQLHLLMGCRDVLHLSPL